MDKNLVRTDNIFFSIIIPTYNRSSFVVKMIDSFLKQTYPHFELIIVDDGSNDDTKAVIENINDSRIKYFWKENGERGSARNFGAKLAKGNYINYFDSDDIAYPNHLEMAQEAIMHFKDPLVFHLGYEMRNENNGLIYRHKPITGSANEKILKVNYINPNPLFVHRDTLGSVSYNSDQGISGTEDWLYHLQLIARYTLLAYDKTITNCMVLHANRSMNIYNGDAVLRRNSLLLKYLNEDSVFINKYGSKITGIAAEMHGLAALHYVLEHKRIRSLKEFYISLKLSPPLILKKRTLAILKYLILGISKADEFKTSDHNAIKNIEFFESNGN